MNHCVIIARCFLVTEQPVMLRGFDINSYRVAVFFFLMRAYSTVSIHNKNINIKCNNEHNNEKITVVSYFYPACLMVIIRQYGCYQSLQWRHNDLDGISNHQSHDFLLKRLFRRRSKKASKLRVTGLCEGNSPVTGEFPAQRASNAENVSIWWRHHGRPLLAKLSTIQKHFLKILNDYESENLDLLTNCHMYITGNRPLIS